MTQEELLQAINESGLDAQELAIVLRFAGALVKRETLRAAMLKERQAQQAAQQASENRIQALQSQFEAIDAELAAQQ